MTSRTEYIQSKESQEAVSLCQGERRPAAHKTTIRPSYQPLPMVFYRKDLSLQVVISMASPSWLLRLKFAGTYRSHEAAQLARCCIRPCRADEAAGCCPLPVLLNRPASARGPLRGQGCLQIWGRRGGAVKSWPCRSSLQKELLRALSQPTCLPPCSASVSPSLGRARGPTQPPRSAH